MDTLQQLQDVLTAEYNTTKKFINAFPEGKNNYAPHEKSMKLVPLAQHITEIFGWPANMLKTEGVDFAEAEKPAVFETKQQLEDDLEKNYADSMEALKNATEADLEPNWFLAYKGR